MDSGVLLTAYIHTMTAMNAIMANTFARCFGIRLQAKGAKQISKRSATGVTYVLTAPCARSFKNQKL